MAGSNYFNPTRDTVKNQKPGYTNECYVALKSWFSEIAEPTGTEGADSLTIATDHTFITGTPAKGFMKAYCLPHTVEAGGKSTGDEGALHTGWTPQFLLPGDSPALQALVEAMANEDLILVFLDANCPGNAKIQYGCDCNPATVTEYEFTSGTTKDGKKGWLIKATSNCRFFYNGSIAVMA